MQISISTSGTPAALRQDVKRSLEQQLGSRAITPGAPELAEAVRTYVDRQMDGVANDASVQVSVSLTISVFKPERAPVAVAPEVATEAASAPKVAQKA